MYLKDFDGVCSDLKIYVILAKEAGLPDTSIAATRDYINDRSGWHRRVAAWYCLAAGWGLSIATIDRLCEAVKRWPNALGNGSSHRKLMEMAKLPADCPHEPDHVLVMMAELRKLKRELLGAPRNADFVKRHRERLLRVCVGVSAYGIDTKMFSLLVATREHDILTAPACVGRSQDDYEPGPRPEHIGLVIFALGHPFGRRPGSSHPR